MTLFFQPDFTLILKSILRRGQHDSETSDQPYFPWIVFLFFGLLGARYYVENIILCDAWCVETHQAIINGAADAPYRYRVLGARIARALPGDVPQKYIAAHILILPIMFFALYRWVLKSTRRPLLAYIGIFLFMIYLPLFFEWYAISLYSSIEVVLLALALANPRAGIRYGLLVVIAALNRETSGLLLLLIFFAWNLRQMPLKINLFWTGVYAFLFAAIFVGLRLILGAAPYYSEIVSRNTTDPRVTSEIVLHNALMLPLWFLLFAGWRLVEPRLRRTVIVMTVPYVVLLAFFAVWNEVRLWMPVLTVALPMITSAFTLIPLDPIREAAQLKTPDEAGK